MISRVRNIRSNMLTRYQVGAAGSHGLETTNCRTGLQDLTVSEQLIETCLQGITTRLQDRTGSEHHIVHACRVSGQGCRISRVRNVRSYMPTRYQDGAAGSHG